MNGFSNYLPKSKMKKKSKELAVFKMLRSSASIQDMLYEI